MNTRTKNGTNWIFCRIISVKCSLAKGRNIPFLDLVYVETKQRRTHKKIKLLFVSSIYRIITFAIKHFTIFFVPIVQRKKNKRETTNAARFSTLTAIRMIANEFKIFFFI